MAVDPRSLGVGPLYSSRRLDAQSVPLQETLRAEAGYYIDPVFERVRERVVYGSNPEPGFNWQDVPVPERHRGFEWRYAVATNREHFAEITRAIDESLYRRQTLDRSSPGAQFVAGIFSPVNLLGIPLGGPLVTGGRVALGQTALRGGIAAGGVEAGLNFGVIQQLDPVQTSTESLVNTASVALFGSGFTAMGAVPAARRLNAQQELREQASRMFNIAQRAQEIGGVDMAAPMGAREARPLGQAEDVQDVNDRYLQELNDLNRELAAVPAGSGEARLIQERIDQANAERQPYAQELFFRSLEEEGINTDDMYRPAQGGDNWFLNWVTTPARRVLTADYGAANNSAKRVIAQLAYDSGLQLEMHRAGVTEGLSIFQKSAADLGEFARANDELLNLWAEDTGAPGIGSSPFAGVDVNATDLARRAQRQGNTQEAWLLEVSRKRLLGEPMTDAQARAADAITRFFESWEEKLIETGQLRTRTNISRQISRLEQEVESLRARLEDADDAGLRTTLQRREDLLEELRFELENPMVARNEPHLPRFWNVGAVKQNRAQLADILSNWYAENPYIFSFNESTRRWERVELATDPDSIARRVDQTIDNILGENQNKDAEEIFVGSNRASNLRARSLDIPNSLVADFIELNPVALMAAYTRRVSPQYHFQKTFGSNREDLQRKIVNEMRSAGVSQANIQRYVRDFDTLYRRVVGRVVDQPEALNQRAAAVLREATSLTYLGGSGIAAVADMGRVVMENEMPTLARSMQSFFDPVVRATNKRELRIAGGALDMLLGSAHMRVVDDQNYNVISNTTMDKVRNAFFTLNLLGPVTVLGKQFAGMNGAHMLIEYSQKLARNEASGFETAYLARYGIDADAARRIAAAPWQTDPNTGLIMANTDAWEGGYVIPETERGRVTVIEDADERFIRKVSPFGDEVAARFNPETNTIYFNRSLIEGEMFKRKAWTKPRKEGVKPLPEDAFQTPQAWANFIMWHELMHTRFSAEDLGLPPQSAAYENRINELAMVEHRRSERVARETAELFRGALNAHINNVVITATAMDRPTVMDGVMYVPNRFGELFGLKPDPNVPGYSRVENGFIALPLQLYGFALANVNKTVGVMMQGAVRNRLAGVTAMMAMGYMISSIRTPDFVWDDMSPQDRLGRAFDMSGVAALYSDLFYTTLQTSLALGGPNITGGVLEPRFPQDPNMVDAVTNVTGAASGWTADMVRSAATFASGDYGEGASQFIRNLPFSNLWFLRDDVNQLGRYIAN